MQTKRGDQGVDSRPLGEGRGGAVIGLFSGSFNPIHIGHLALANYLCEFAALDEVWFVVSPHNPLKDSVGLMDERQRFAWVKRSIEGYPRFVACDIEFELPKPSYTIQTLRALRERYPDREFVLIIGADNWACFEEWRDYRTILAEYRIVIYPRKGFDVVIPQELAELVRVTDAPLMEVSSSFIREAYREGKDVRFFLPEGIREDLTPNPSPSERGVE